MRIDEFSIGDIVQRVEHARCNYGNGRKFGIIKPEMEAIKHG